MGFAETELPIALLNVLDGDQLYWTAPLAVRTIDSPKQIEALVLEETIGGGFTITGIFATEEHPKLSTPKTLYVVFTTGKTLTVSTIVELIAVLGDQI